MDLSQLWRNAQEDWVKLKVYGTWLEPDSSEAKALARDKEKTGSQVHSRPQDTAHSTRTKCAGEMLAKILRS